MIINKEIDINNKKRSEIEILLEENEFPKLDKFNDKSKLSYDYLLAMPIYNLTNEKIEELKNQKNDKTVQSFRNRKVNSTVSLVFIIRAIASNFIYKDIKLN